VETWIILKLHSENINTVVAKIIPWSNYPVGSNLIKELNSNLNNFWTVNKLRKITVHCKNSAQKWNRPMARTRWTHFVRQAAKRPETETGPRPARPQTTLPVPGRHGWVCSCCSQILCIVYTMRDFGVGFDRVPLMWDNTSAISVAKNPVFHKRMRHLERRYHFMRDHVEKGALRWDT
jgi:hypothetical protein